jgi:hypothetical protein
MKSIADEDDFTSRLAQSIQQSLNGRLIGGVRFSAYTKKLKSRGSTSEESLLGADLMLVLRIRSGRLDLAKGFLIQAKMNTGPGTRLIVKDAKKLSKQIGDMLVTTSDAYVWGYSSKGVVVARAGSYGAALDAKMAGSVGTQTLMSFFRSGLRSQVGDTRLSARSAPELAALATDLRAKRLLAIEAIGGGRTKRGRTRRPSKQGTSDMQRLGPESRLLAEEQSVTSRQQLTSTSTAGEASKQQRLYLLR